MEREFIGFVADDIPYMKQELVKCKECKHWSYGKDLCTLHDMGMLANDFCSYGEARDEKCKECWYWSEVHKRCENKCGCQFKPYAERSRR